MKICAMPWFNLTVHHSGKVVPCCADNELKLILGDLKKKTLNQIMNSKKVKEFQKKHLNNELDFEPCKNCKIKKVHEIDLVELKRK